jgi:Ca-activated chloride channel family protein
MRFASPMYLLLFIPLAALLWLELKKRTGAIVFSDTSFLSKAAGWTRHLRYILLVVNLSALSFMVLALARPQQGRVYEETEAKGVDIMLCMDASETMSYEDFSPKNRLEVAKQRAVEFAKERPGDRIGLVVFGNGAMTQSPLTANRQILNDIISRLAIGTVDPTRTAIGMGLASAVGRLKDSKSKDKLVILLTDGLNNAGDIDPLTAAQLAQSYGIKVYCIGVGSTETITIMRNTVFGPQPMRVQFDLDMKTLEEVSRITGGQAFLATDAEALKLIYDEINKLEPTTYKVNRHTVYHEKAALFLFPALALMLLSITLSTVLLRRLP